MPNDSGENEGGHGSKERDRGDRHSSKQKASAGGGGSAAGGSSSSKSKDLSHVPCKFYKVGGCTAGSSCPFSHSLVEPGGQKETCAWFVKGNCKFGHKCALAHILPGQDMSMDRKNKKAAQQANQASGGGKKDKAGGGGRGHREDRDRGERDRGSGERGGERKSALLAGGSTAPTRMLNGGSAAKPPMNLTLKATISPSAPAPPLKDSDFAALDDMEGVSKSKDSGTAEKKEGGDEQGLPTSNPRRSAPATQNEFGPIGSPPNPRDSMSPRTTGTGTIGIGTSSTTGQSRTRRWADTPESSVLGTPGFGDFMAQAKAAQQQQQQQATQVSQALEGQGPSSFSANVVDADESFARFGVARSVGAIQGLDYESTMDAGRLGSSASALSAARRGLNQPRLPHHHSDSVVVIEDADADGDIEFIPGSLTDLLTPEERNERHRRMSRTNSGQPVSAGFFGATHNRGGSLLGGGGEEGLGVGMAVGGGGLPGSYGHRYSRSVPASGLLGDMKSIWSDGQGGLPASPRNPSFLSSSSSQHQQPLSSSLHRTSTPLLDPSSSSSLNADANLSMSVESPSGSSLSRMISPSNASAAFLPGFHSHYAAARKGASTNNTTNIASGLTTGLLSAGDTMPSGLSSSLAVTSGLSGLSLKAREEASQTRPSLSSASSNPSYLGTLDENKVSGSPSGSFVGSSALHTHLSANGMSTTYRTAPSPFDLTGGMHLKGGGIQRSALDRTRTPSGLSNQLAPSHIPSGALTSRERDPSFGLANPDASNNLMSNNPILSPSARALQAHAPGQSLPQGLAAGLSRIHALPGGVVSPGTPSALSTLAAGTTPGGTILGGATNAGAGTSPAPSASLGNFTSGPYGEQPGSLSAYSNLHNNFERGYGATYGLSGGYGNVGNSNSLGFGGGGADGYGGSGYGHFGLPPPGFGGIPGGGGYGGFGMPGGQGGGFHEVHHHQGGWGQHPQGHPPGHSGPLPPGLNGGFVPDQQGTSNASEGGAGGQGGGQGPPGLTRPPSSDSKTSPGGEATPQAPAVKLSYSAAASKAAAPGKDVTGSGPPGLRKPPAVVSPPVGVTGDDDDLFSMDG